MNLYEYTILIHAPRTHRRLARTRLYCYCVYMVVILVREKHSQGEFPVMRRSGGGTSLTAKREMGSKLILCTHLLIQVVALANYEDPEESLSTPCDQDGLQMDTLSQ